MKQSSKTRSRTGRFSGLPLALVFLAADRFAVTRPFQFTRPNGLQVGVPVLQRGARRLGFVTNGASIPRIFWPIIGSPEGRYFPAAVLHDYLYVAKLTDRKTADLIFLEAMAALGVSWLKRRTMHAAVRAAAWLVWHRHPPLDTSALTPENPGLHFAALPR